MFNYIIYIFEKLNDNLKNTNIIKINNFGGKNVKLPTFNNSIIEDSWLAPYEIHFKELIITLYKEKIKGKIRI